MKPNSIPIRGAIAGILLCLAVSLAPAAPRNSSTTSSPQALLHLIWSEDSGGGGTSDIVEIVGWSHEIVSPRDAASGLPTGKRQHNPFTITKPVDKTTPLLREAHKTGKPLAGVELLLVQTDRSGEPVPYFTIRLTNANIASTKMEMEAEGAQLPLESISFVYEKIIWTYQNGGVTSEDDWGAPEP